MFQFFFFSWKEFPNLRCLVSPVLTCYVPPECTYSFFARPRKVFEFFFFFFLLCVAVLAGDFTCSLGLLARIPAYSVVRSSHARCSRCMACLAPVGSMWCFCVLFGPGPKPRQARDGHSWRMVIQREWRPLFSFCQRAPRLSSPFLCRVVCGSQGCGCPARALTRAHFSLWFAVSLWTCWGLLPPRCSLFRGPLPPCRGRMVDPPRCIPFPNGVCTRPDFCEPCGAPGAFRALTPEVPASELAVALPVPRRASSAPWCLCL